MSETQTDADRATQRRPWAEVPGKARAMRARAVGGPIDLAGAVVVHPDTDAGRRAAGRLVAGLGSGTGAGVVLRSGGFPDGSRVPSGGRGTLAPTEVSSDEVAGVRILLGNLSSNAEIAELYHAGLTPVDGAIPGPGGWFLRSHRDVWGDGGDVVVVGVSDDADLDSAVDRLLGHLGHGGLADVHDVGLADAVRDQLPVLDPDHPAYASFADDARQAYRTRKHRGFTPYLTHLADMFALTGQRVFADRYVAMMQDMMVETSRWVPDQWGRWGFDADFQAARVISTWHAIADSPAFTDEDRDRIASHLVDFLGNSEEQWHGHRDSPYPARHNHYTFAALGLLYGALLLGRVHRLPQTAEWVAMADECFTPMLGAAKSTEDCEAYGWLTLAHTLRYALLRPVPGYVTGGAGMRILERSLVTMDNLVGQVPYGDASAFRGSRSELDFWRPAVWLLADERYGELLARKAVTAPAHGLAITGITSLVHGYDVPVGERSASELVSGTGVHVLPLDMAYLETHQAVDPQPDNGFDKISFRDDFAAGEPYLLLDGVDNGGHGHRDAGAVLRLTWRDRIWLEDAEYDKISANFHNTVVIARDGIVGLRPPYAALGSYGDDGTVAHGGSILTYSGARWSRTVEFSRGESAPRQGFRVVDEITAEEPGVYEVTLLWRTVGATELSGDTWTISMGPERLAITTSAAVGTGIASERNRREIAEPYLPFRTDWHDYEWAEDEESVLQDTIRVRLEPGQSVRFESWLTDPGPGPSVEPGAPRSASRGRDVTTVLPSGEVITATGSSVTVSRQGSTIAEFDTAAEVTALGAGPYGGVVVGQADGLVALHALDGTVRWQGDFPAHMGHPALVNVVGTARLDPGAAEPAVIVGTESCHVHAWSADGAPLWSYEVVHACNGIAAADLDGDGRDEVVAISGYWSWHVIGADGAKRCTVRGIEGSGGQAVLAHRGLAIFGGWDGHVTAYRPDGERVWDVATGDIVTALVPAGDDVVAASRSGRLYRIGPDGTLRWWQPLPVDAVVVQDDTVVVALGDEVRWLATDGSTSRVEQRDAPVAGLWTTMVGLVVT